MTRTLFALLLLTSAAFADSSLPAPATPGIDPAVARVRVGTGTNAPWRGAAEPLVTIVQFSNFQCPYCGRVEATLTKVLESYPGKVRIVWRNQPLAFHTKARPAHKLALAAHRRGRFWQMHARLFANQPRLEFLEEHAAALGFDAEFVRAALGNPALESQIAADEAEALALGSQGTPAHFVNGRHLSGAQPFESFKKFIDEEIATAERLLASGIPRSRLYEVFTARAARHIDPLR